MKKEKNLFCLFVFCLFVCSCFHLKKVDNPDHKHLQLAVLQGKLCFSHCCHLSFYLAHPERNRKSKHVCYLRRTKLLTVSIAFHVLGYRREGEMEWKQVTLRVFVRRTATSSTSTLFTPSSSIPTSSNTHFVKYPLRPIPTSSTPIRPIQLRPIPLCPFKIRPHPFRPFPLRPQPFCPMPLSPHLRLHL